MLAATTRLPGVLCETRMPNPGRQPLRLDVAGFVGLAARGPLDAPVMIEDFSQYRLVFGGDLPVARVGGRPIFAHLPRTVEAFFENGGQRCYVVRVAGAGNRPNRFQIPGLLYEADENDWQPVVVPAAWPGRWSDLVSVATSTRIRPVQIRTDSGDLELSGEEINEGVFELPLRLPGPDAVRKGDLLRLHLSTAGDERYQIYLRAGAVAEEPTLTAIQLSGTPVVVRPAEEGGRIFQTNPAAGAPESVARLSESGWSPLPFSAAQYGWSTMGDDTSYRLTMPIASDVPIEAGDLLRLSGPAGTPPIFFTTGQLQRGPDPGGSDDGRLSIDADQPLGIVDTVADQPHTLIQVDVLSFDLRIREGETTIEQWPDLRFSPEAAYWEDVLQPNIGPEQVNPAAFTVNDFTGRSLRLGSSGETGLSPLPIGMGPTFTYYGPQEDPLTTDKDGLETYDPVALFIDPEFQMVGIRNIVAVGNDLLHLSPEPRRLRGIHSLLPVDDVALVAVPDLAHIGWEMVDPPVFTEPEEDDEIPEEPAGFHPCPLEEAEEDDELVAPVIQLDPADATMAPSSQAWLEDLPEQLGALDHDDAAMLDVQRALVRLCAARAEIVTLLSLPRHFNTQAAAQWQQELTKTPEFLGGRALSYAAAYHGWPAIREETAPSLAPLRYLPPDGFAAGMIAAREIRRGAWIAPANVSLHSVVAMDPAFEDEEWAVLYRRQINVIRRLPGRFALMSALTLSSDRHYRQINVRRLLIWLRKVALREGQRYVFETNNERFRTLVQTYFESILNRVLERGGLQAFQVVTGDEINTQHDYDNGRFLIALKVAPTLPVEFITITMLRSSNDAISVVEGSL